MNNILQINECQGLETACKKGHLTPQGTQATDYIRIVSRLCKPNSVE